MGLAGMEWADAEMRGWLCRAFLGYALLSFLYKAFQKIKSRQVFLAATKNVPRLAEKGPFIGWFAHQAKNSDRRVDWWQDQYNERRTPDGQIPRVLAGPPAYLMPTKSGIYHTQDPAIVKHILKDKFNNYIKTEPVVYASGAALFPEWMGDGIFVVDHGPHSKDGGASWFHQRKLAANMFTMSNFRTAMHDTFVANTARLNARIRKDLEGGKAAIDIQDLFFRLTMDSFTTIGFGGQVMTIEGGEDPYANAFDGAHRCVIDWLIGLKMLLTGLIRLFLPWPLDSLVVTLFRVTNPTYREFRAHMGVLTSASQSTIDTRREAKSDDAPATDILGLFMAARDAEGKPFEDRFLRDVVLNFMIAGRDTTACTLSWTFYLLSLNPAVKARLEEELRENLTELPTYDEIRGLRYLRGVIYESLRLFPPVPQDPKTAVEPDVLPDGTVVPAGVRIFFNPYGMGRNPALWDAPEEMKPERWESGEPDPYKFPVFQAGPRICLGKEMAIMEAATVTALILREFDFKLKGAAGDYAKSKSFTMAITPSLELVMNPRNL